MFNQQFSNLLRWISRLRDQGYFNQFFMAFMVLLPFVNYGMVMGWLSPATPILQSLDGPAPEPISDNIISWMGAVMFLPLISCAVFVGKLADTWGRKFSMMLTGILLVVSWAIILFSLHPWALITSRIVAGMAGVICYIVQPMYLKEIASDNIRGAVCSLFILSQNMGFLLVYLAGDLLPFRVLLWICIAIPAIFLLQFYFMPETPVFLVKQGKIQEARVALAWLRNTTVDNKNVEEAIQKLAKEEEYAKNIEKPSWKSLIQNKTRFKALRISISVMVLQETGGYLIVLLFAGTIFARASDSISMSLSPNKQAIVVGAIQLLGSIVASSIVEKTGRKWLLVAMSLVTGLSMLTLGLWFYITSVNIWLPGWLPIFAVCLCIFSYSAGFQPTPYVITAELFSFQYRGMVNSIINFTCGFSDFAQTKAYDPLRKLIGIHWIFIIFSCICFFACFYAATCVPETKNKTVEEIYAILEGNENKKKVKDNPEIGTETSQK